MKVYFICTCSRRRCTLIWGSCWASRVRYLKSVGCRLGLLGRAKPALGWLWTPSKTRCVVLRQSYGKRFLVENQFYEVATLYLSLHTAYANRWKCSDILGWFSLWMVFFVCLGRRNEHTRRLASNGCKNVTRESSRAFVTRVPCFGGLFFIIFVVFRCLFLVFARKGVYWALCWRIYRVSITGFLKRQCTW